MAGHRQSCAREIPGRWSGYVEGCVPRLMKPQKHSDIPGVWSGYVEGMTTLRSITWKSVIFPADGRATLKVHENRQGGSHERGISRPMVGLR